MQIKFFSVLVPIVTAQSTASPSPPPAICSDALLPNGAPWHDNASTSFTCYLYGLHGWFLVLRKSLSPAGPPPDKPFSFAGF